LRTLAVCAGLFSFAVAQEAARLYIEKDMDRIRQLAEILLSDVWPPPPPDSAAAAAADQ
jgi:hypothetical protein